VEIICENIRENKMYDLNPPTFCRRLVDKKRPCGEAGSWMIARKHQDSAIISLVKADFAGALGFFNSDHKEVFPRKKSIALRESLCPGSESADLVRILAYESKPTVEIFEQTGKTPSEEKNFLLKKRHKIDTSSCRA
jgi:hypothetical protein